MQARELRHRALRASAIAPARVERAIAAAWDESKHPRDRSGRFGQGGGGGEGRSRRRRGKPDSFGSSHERQEDIREAASRAADRAIADPSSYAIPKSPRVRKTLRGLLNDYAGDARREGSRKAEDAAERALDRLRNAEN